MSRFLLSFAIASAMLVVSLPLLAQGPGQGAGQGAGRGQGWGAGRGAGQGARQDGAMPDRGQGWGQNRGDMVTLVNRADVQAELKLDPEQRKQLVALGETEHARLAAQMLSERGSCERTDQRRAVMAQVRQDIERIMDSQQWERLNQIWVQIRGVRALQSDRISKTLEISRPQQKQIDQLLAGGFQGRGGQIEAQVLKVLTDDQRQQFVALQGPRFQQDRSPMGGAAGDPPRDGRGRMQRPQ